MAEMVSSAVVQEAVNKIVSGMLDKYEGKSTAEEHMERLEMAHIKLEAALETSAKWHITDAPLLRWQKKLKRAAQECDDTLHKCRQRVQEEEEMKQEVRNSSFPKRIAHAAKSLIPSVFYHNINESSRSAIRRFEWFAHGANEFLRFVEYGGTPRHCMFPAPLIRHLLAGETLEYKSVRGNKRHLFFIRPFNIAERRIEARLIFDYKDGSAPEDNFFLSMMLQLSESMDIVGIVIQCLQLFAPYFKSTAETVRKELTQLPMRDFSWVPYVDSCHKEHWDNIHSICTQWFRPNPLCCKKHGQHKICDGSNIDTSELPGVSLEPVIKVNLQCQVSLLGFNREMTTAEGKISLKDFPHLKVDLVFTPHGSSEDLLPAVESSLIEIINGGEQHCLHTNITLEQLEEIMLPKVIDCFCQHTKATVYQMHLKSRHGTVYLQVEKAAMKMPSTRRRTIRGDRKGKLLQQQDQEPEIPTHVISELFNLCVTHAPVRLQGSIVDWIQKEKETQLAPLSLRLKF